MTSPWIKYVSELTQMFKYDPQVHIVYDNDEVEVKVYVDSGRKAFALTELLPSEKTFGGVTLKINVIPANLYDTVTADDLFASAFRGNPAFSFVKKITGIFAHDLTYVVFKNRVVQYYNDDLGDIYGQCSTLYQEIAKDIFEPKEGVFYCTDVEEPVYSASVAESAFRAVPDCPRPEWP